MSFAKEQVNSSILQIENDDGGATTHRIYLSSGEILKTDNKKIIIALRNHFLKSHLLSFQFDDHHLLLSYEKLEYKKNFLKNISKLADEEYSPSHLSEGESEELFKSFRKGARSYSQCFNRAHVWVYESKKALEVNSMKVFLFFTKKFIREYDYKWWFHVAPAIYLKKITQNKLSILDPYFSSSPLPLNEWIHLFIPKNIKCPEISTYSQYEEGQEDESCFTFEVPMYYLQPLDLKALEERSEVKNSWKKNEIKRSYRNGFGIWDSLKTL